VLYTVIPFLEIPVAVAVPELYNRGENRGKWCFVRAFALGNKIKNNQPAQAGCQKRGLSSFYKLFDWSMNGSNQW
jgi:hypothetical protein